MDNLMIGLRALVERIGWNDPTKRRTILRGLIGVVGYFIAVGQITIPHWVYDLLSRPDIATLVGALFISAGDKNPKAEGVIADILGALDQPNLPPEARAALTAILDARSARQR